MSTQSWMNGFLRLDMRRLRQRNRSESKRRATRRRLSTEPLENRLLLTTYVVDNLFDNTTVDGTVTLREAIEAANSNAGVGDAPAGTPGLDTINFQSGLTGTINMSLGEFPVTDDLTINGPGAADITIDAGGLSRIFRVTDGVSANAIDVEISGLTLTGGSLTGNGGAIFSTENFTLRDSFVTGNTATTRGGGVFANNSDVATLIENSTLSGNTALQGGGVGAYAVNTGTVTIRGTTISGNSARDGGGFFLLGVSTIAAAVTVENSTVSGNEALEDGGGIDASLSSAIPDVLVIRNTTITGNVADADNNGTGLGGGVLETGGTVSGATLIENTIVAGNVDNTGTAPDLFFPTPTVEVVYSLIGDNTGNGLTEAPVGSPDADGNLIGGPTGGVINPLLGPLQNNGGPTETHALQPGSPAIDAGDPAFVAPPVVDQRGAPFARVIGGRIDIGAFEVESTSLKDPGFSYVDANNDQLFNPADDDVPLDNGELNDGVFDTDVAEGPDYTVPIAGAGLVINGPAITTQNMNYSADGDLTINTDLTARQRRGTLALTSRDDDVLFDDPTVTTSGNLIITALNGDVLSEDDSLLAIGPSSRIHLDAGFVSLLGTRVEANKEVEIDAVRFLFNPSAANPAIMTATPNTLGRVDVHADFIDVSDAQIEARKEIVMDGIFFDALRSRITANGHGSAKIDLNSTFLIDLSDAEIIARKTIDIESTAGGFDLRNGIIARDALIDAVGGGSTTVRLSATNAISMGGATVRATDKVTIESVLNTVFAFDTTLEANVTSAGTVSVTSGPGQFVTVAGATVRAKRDAVFSGAAVFAQNSDIHATGPQISNIEMDAEIDVYLTDAVLRAGVGIDVNAVTGSIIAERAQLLACGTASSQVRMSSGANILLEDAVLRAGNLIDILAADLVDLDSASVGIWRLGIGDISVEGTTVDVTDAVLKAPDLLTLTGAILGTALDDTPGTLACPS